MPLKYIRRDSSLDLGLIDSSYLAVADSTPCEEQVGNNAQVESAQDLSQLSGGCPPVDEDASRAYHPAPTETQIASEQDTVVSYRDPNQLIVIGILDVDGVVAKNPQPLRQLAKHAVSNKLQRESVQYLSI